MNDQLTALGLHQGVISIHTENIIKQYISLITLGDIREKQLQRNIARPELIEE